MYSVNQVIRKLSRGHYPRGEIIQAIRINGNNQLPVHPPGLSILVGLHPLVLIPHYLPQQHGTRE